MANETLELVVEGKKLGIPKQQIDYVVSKLHVGTSDEDVQRILADRIGKAKVAWPNAAVKQALGYAIQSHRKNQDLYGKVMSGNLGQPKKKKQKEDEPVVESVLDDEQPRNDYYDLIQATISGKPADFKVAFDKIIGPKVVDAVLEIKQGLKETLYAPDEEVVETTLVNVQGKSLLESFAKKSVK